MSNKPSNVVILHQFPRGFRAPSASPFALKLETWLLIFIKLYCHHHRTLATIKFKIYFTSITIFLIKKKATIGRNRVQGDLYYKDSKNFRCAFFFLLFSCISL